MGLETQSTSGIKRVSRDVRDIIELESRTLISMVTLPRRASLAVQNLYGVMAERCSFLHSEEASSPVLNPETAGKGKESGWISYP